VGQDADTVTEEDRRDEGQDLLDLAPLEALPGQVRTEHVDVSVSGGRTRLGNGCVEVIQIGDVPRRIRLRRVMSDDVDRAGPGAVEGPFPVSSAVRVVAAVGIGPDQ
jgi:hypothetical protein